MVGRIDADVACDVGELADARRPDLAFRDQIGIVPDLRLGELHPLADLDIAAERARHDLGGRMDEGLLRQARRRCGLKPGHGAHAASFAA